MDEADQKILQDIETYGCSVMHIAAEDELPPFAFSMGISKTSKAPEVLVIGLKQPVAHAIANEYNEVLQLVYPNTSGVWPWDEAADDWFRSWQPILSHPAELAGDAG